MIWMKPLNAAERSQYLKSIGLMLDYVTEQEDETNIILLRTKKPVDVELGHLIGIEMAVMRRNVVVWTCHTKKARKVAMDFDLRCILHPGECEVQVPFSLCDKVLPLLGVRPKRKVSEKSAKAFAQRMANLK